MADLIPTYDDPAKESVFQLAISGQAFVLVAEQALVEFELVNDFDKQRHKNQNFGRKKFLGINFVKAEVNFTVYPDEERNFWDRVVPLLRQRGKKGNSPALEVLNYQLNRAGITHCNILRARIGPPLAKSGRAVTLHIEEWSSGPTKPKPSVAAAEQFDPSPGGLIDQDLKKGALRNNT